MRISVLAFLFLPGENFPSHAQAKPGPAGTGKGAPTAPERTKDQTYDERKKFAVILFRQNHYLEALPVFQDRAKQNPGDAEVLFGYWACLIDHSATLKDEPEARSERLHARDLLQEAKQMGLMSLLKTLSADGAMRFAGRLEVVAAIAMAEQADALAHAAKVMIGRKLEAIAGDPDLKLLKKLAGAQMLELYVLLSVPDRGIAIDYLGYREKNRRKLEEYLSQFVVPPAPATAKP